MPRKRYRPEQIIQHLRTVELEQIKGLSLEKVSKKIGVTSQTLVRWRNEYGVHFQIFSTNTDDSLNLLHKNNGIQIL